MSEIKLNLTNSKIPKETILKYKKQVEEIHENLHKRANKKDDFVGWLELPTKYDKKEFNRIKKAAQKIKKESDILIVIGIRRIIFRSKGSNRSPYKLILQHAPR